MFHGISFDPENETSLPDSLFETRNALTGLAVEIVAAKYDLNVTGPRDYRELIKHLYHEIKALHDAYDQQVPNWED